jgi:protein tyrosine phosphatase (PTP) superfamily phosphohydrolase (DUF442 family)
MLMPKSIPNLLIVMLLGMGWGLHSMAQEVTPMPTTTVRPANWATPMELTGVPNLHKVSDNLYRGAQPTAEGMAALKKLGIKTVVNLRAFHSDRDEIGELDLAYEHIQMVAVHAEKEDVIRFLKIVTDPTKTPVYVHCMQGSDRTGLMSAMYRIFVQNWTKADAIREMTEGGYGFHEIFHNLVTFIEHLDLEVIKVKAGLTPPLVK